MKTADLVQHPTIQKIYAQWAEASARPTTGVIAGAAPKMRAIGHLGGLWILGLGPWSPRKPVPRYITYGVLAFLAIAGVAAGVGGVIEMAFLFGLAVMASGSILDWRVRAYAPAKEPEPAQQAALEAESVEAPAQTPAVDPDRLRS